MSRWFCQTRTNFWTLFQDNDAHLFPILLFKLLEADCGAEASWTTANDANVDVICCSLDFFGVK